MSGITFETDVDGRAVRVECFDDLGGGGETVELETANGWESIGHLERVPTGVLVFTAGSSRVFASARNRDHVLELLVAEHERETLEV